MAASCLAAGLSAIKLEEGADGFVEAGSGVRAGVAESSGEDPGAMVTGFDNGDGLIVRLPTSVVDDEPRGGMFTCFD
ncbi:hypothetical protein PC116_g32427 [Phytophthora cactorum]|nr:hypothetical protein PC116_g32427 [Phytophthora cactorum]